MYVFNIYNMEKYTQQEIELMMELYEELGPKLLTKRINKSADAISQKAKKLGLKFDSSKFYKSNDFDLIVSKSINLVDICRNLELKPTGGNRNTIKKWIEIKNIDISHFHIKRKTGNKQTDIFVENSGSDRRVVKNRLYKDGIKERKCEFCGQDENWHGSKISLILDHKNGINNDNRIDNLRILCPNCNATLDTNGGKNIKNKLKQIVI